MSDKEKSGNETVYQRLRRLELEKQEREKPVSVAERFQQPGRELLRRFGIGQSEGSKS